MTQTPKEFGADGCRRLPASLAGYEAPSDCVAGGKVLGAAGGAGGSTYIMPALRVLFFIGGGATNEEQKHPASQGGSMLKCVFDLDALPFVSQMDDGKPSGVNSRVYT